MISMFFPSPLDRAHLARSDPLKVRRITNPVDEVRSFCVIASEIENAADLNRNFAFRDVDRVSMINEAELIVEGIFDVHDRERLSRSNNKTLTLWMRFSHFRIKFRTLIYVYFCEGAIGKKINEIQFIL